MKKLSVIGTVITVFLTVGKVLAGPVPDMEVIPIPEFPAVALLIAFLVGVIGAALFTLITKDKKESKSFFP